MFLSRWLTPQVKKLVYVYLVRYAEEQQDLALLSISTFQRGLKVSDVLLLKICVDVANGWAVKNSVLSKILIVFGSIYI